MYPDKPGSKLTLDSSVNLIEVKGHKGPHGDEYWKIVLNRLTNAVKDKKAHSQEDVLGVHDRDVQARNRYQYQRNSPV